MCCAVVEGDDLLRSVWVTALDWVVREVGDIKLRFERQEVTSYEKLNIPGSNRTFQAKEQLVLKFVFRSVGEPIRNFQI
jgi:hypothetical protein